MGGVFLSSEGLLTCQVLSLCEVCIKWVVMMVAVAVKSSMMALVGTVELKATYFCLNPMPRIWWLNLTRTQQAHCIEYPKVLQLGLCCFWFFFGKQLIHLIILILTA